MTLDRRDAASGPEQTRADPSGPPRTRADPGGPLEPGLRPVRLRRQRPRSPRDPDMSPNSRSLVLLLFVAAPWIGIASAQVSESAKLTATPPAAGQHFGAAVSMW